MGIRDRILEIFMMLRMKEWLFSKIPFMFVPLFIHIFTYGQYQGTAGLGLCLQYFIFIVTFYGFGYAINDFSDKEIDRKVGKKNVMGEIGEAAGIAVLGGLVMGCLPLFAAHAGWEMAGIFAFVYFWGAAYSARPFRFKERGASGVLVSSLAQRTIPLLPLLGVDGRIWQSIFLWGGVGFLTGLRYILIHQYEDMENDKKSGTRTFVNLHNGDAAWMIGACLGVEMLILLGAGMYRKLAVYWVLLAICLVQSLLVFYTVHSIYRKSYFASFICVPLEDFYNFYLPLAWLLLLVREQALWAAPLAILLLVGWKDMCGKWKMAYFGIRHWREERDG